MLTFKIKDFFAHLSGKRIENSEKYKLTNFFLAVLFPIFIVCLAEINQMKTPSKLVLFISEKPSIMLFNIMVAAIIYGTLLFLFRGAFRRRCLRDFCILYSVRWSFLNLERAGTILKFPI